MAKFEPGHEPIELRESLYQLWKDVNAAFPDGTVNWAGWDHEKLDAKAEKLCRILGYSNTAEFLKAYGFKVEEPLKLDTKSDIDNSELDSILKEFGGFSAENVYLDATEADLNSDADKPILERTEAKKRDRYAEEIIIEDMDADEDAPARSRKKLPVILACVAVLAVICIVSLILSGKGKNAKEVVPDVPFTESVETAALEPETAENEPNLYENSTFYDIEPEPEPTPEQVEDSASFDDIDSNVLLPEEGSKLATDFDSRSGDTLVYLNVDNVSNQPELVFWGSAIITDGVSDYIQYLKNQDCEIALTKSEQSSPHSGLTVYTTEMKIENNGVSWTVKLDIQDEKYLEYELDMVVPAAN